MDGNKTATAKYTPYIPVGGFTTSTKTNLTYTWIGWIGINSALTAAFCVAAFIMKKRRNTA
jgi:hypothetical protein